MTTIGITHDRARTMPQPVLRMITARQALLACGVLSSLLYVFTDVLGGLRYEGYSFASQAISELGAIGAPSKSLVDPLFIAYNVLAAAFGIGVFRAAATGQNSALRVVGAMLLIYGAIGLAASAVAGPTFFAMHQRGTGSVADDSPHIILTGVLVFFLLVAMGFGTLALGRRFRVYTLATIVIALAFGALTALYAPRVAANQPTPGMGIVERIDVYASMLWLAVLSIALLRRPGLAEGGALP
jgi:hypothetical membrane protein